VLLAKVIAFGGIVGTAHAECRIPGLQPRPLPEELDNPRAPQRRMTIHSTSVPAVGARPATGTPSEGPSISAAPRSLTTVGMNSSAFALPEGAQRLDPAVAQVVDSVGADDVRGFIRALPADEEARRALMRKYATVPGAFMDGAIAIVKQLLAWYPDLLRNPNVNADGPDELLDMTASGIRFAPSSDTRRNRGRLELLDFLAARGAHLGDTSLPLSSVAEAARSPEQLLAARKFLDAGAKIDGATPESLSPLALAAQHGNVELVLLMLQYRQASQHSLDQALAMTSVDSQNPIVSVLVAHGAKLRNGATPFAPAAMPALWTAAAQYAAWHDATLLRILLESHPDRETVNAHPGAGASPLMMVADNADLTRLLLDLGADPTYRDAEGQTALHKAARHDLHAAHAGESDADATRDAADQAQSRALVVALLLEHGADANARDSNGITPLMWLENNDGKSIETMLAHGATINPHPTDSRGLPNAGSSTIGPVSWALLDRNDVLADMLLLREKPVAEEDCGAIYYAAQTGATRTLSDLLRRGADARVRDGAGFTPLMVAAFAGQVAAMGLLVDGHAAQVDETLAAMPDPTNLLLRRRDSVSAFETPLFFAVRAHQKAAAEFLVRRGADVNHRNDSGVTPLDLAQWSGDAAIVAALTRSRASAPTKISR